MHAPKITLPAFAKINWTLRVIGRRADGYHELDTLFQTISLHDTLTLSIIDSARIVFSCNDRGLPTDDRNLVCRAAAALESRYQPQKGAYIRLEKRIPAQAGLGGGSADAAMALIGLSCLWNLETSPEILLEIGATLGADVPFFFFGGAALGAGTGSDISPQPGAGERFLLVLKPNASVSTAVAYEALRAPSLTTPPSDIILLGSPRVSDYGNVDDSLWNDFEPVLSRLEPEIGRAKTALLKAGARGALLAGSGSAVFGVFDNRQAQERAIQVIDLEAGWRVFPCETVGRDQYRSAMGSCRALLAPTK